MLQKEVDGYQILVKRLADSAKAKQDRLKAEEATLSPAVRTQRQNEVNDAVEKFTRTRDSLEATIQRRQAELMQPILDLVNKVLSEVRTEDGYAAILDISSNNGLLVAYDKNLDITDRVLPKVRSRPAPKLPAVAGAPATGPAGVSTKIPPQ
jgi:outer membrane protein